MFQPADHILWDMWSAHEGERHHVHDLQAPKGLSDPEQRHDLAEVGHAVSRDLIEREERDVAFTAGPEGGWDDRPIYTSSVLDHGGELHLLSTSTCWAEQRGTTGLASSDDIATWTVHPPTWPTGPRVRTGSRARLRRRRGQHLPRASVVPTDDGDRLIAARFLLDRVLHGALSDPAPVRWDDDGPHVDADALWLGAR